MYMGRNDYRSKTTGGEKTKERNDQGPKQLGGEASSGDEVVWGETTRNTSKRIDSTKRENIWHIKEPVTLDSTI